MPIRILKARQLYDSLGNPTLEVDLVTELGLFRAGVPNTDKKLNFEMVQVRDNNPEEHHGLGVSQAVKNINTIIAPELIKENIEVTHQKEIDEFMINLDNSETRFKLGGNSMMVVSMAVAKAGAAKKGIPLYRHISDLASINAVLMPVPHFVILSGGAAANYNLPFLEYTLLPNGAESFAEAYRLGTEIYRQLKRVLEIKFGSKAIMITESGGLVAPFPSHNSCMLLLTDLISSLGYENKVKFGLNANATDLFSDGSYNLDVNNTKSVEIKSPSQLGDYYLENLKEFGVISVEDPFHYDDWPAWSTLCTNPCLQVVASDLTQTDIKRCTLAIDRKAVHACTLRLNQCGTLTQMLDVYKLLQSNGIDVVVEDRLGDTDDLFLADLTVGLASGQVHCGAPCRGEHVGKYNQILRIEQEIGVFSKYAGKNFRQSVE